MSRSQRSRLLVGAMATFAGFSAFLIAPASVSPLLVAEFHVDKAAIGAAISAAYVGWLLFQLPSGYLMDRYDNRRLLAVAVAVFAVAAGAGALSESYLGFLLSRAVAGASAGILWGVGANVVGRTFSEGRRDLATGVYVASGPLGLAIGQFAGPILAEAVGLRAAFPAYVVLSVAGFALFRGAAPATAGGEERVGLGQFTRALSDRSVLVLALSALCGNGAWLFLNSWAPTFGVEVVALPLATVGALTALAPLAGAVARSGGGLTAERVGRRATISGSLLLAVPPIAAFPLVVSTAGFGGVLLLAGVCLQFGVGVYYVLAQGLVAEELSGTAISAITAFQLLGGLLAPVAGGWLVETASWGVAFSAAASTALVGAFVVLLSSRGSGAKTG